MTGGEALRDDTPVAEWRLRESRHGPKGTRQVQRLKVERHSYCEVVDAAETPRSSRQSAARDHRLGLSAGPLQPPLWLRTATSPSTKVRERAEAVGVTPRE